MKFQPQSIPGGSVPRRSPCGERGLKLSRSPALSGARCRSPCGERGLKSKPRKEEVPEKCRSPCGERGLK